MLEVGSMKTLCYIVLACALALGLGVSGAEAGHCGSAFSYGYNAQPVVALNAGYQSYVAPAAVVVQPQAVVVQPYTQAVAAPVVLAINNNYNYDHGQALVAGHYGVQNILAARDLHRHFHERVVVEKVVVVKEKEKGPLAKLKSLVQKLKGR